MKFYHIIIMLILPLFISYSCEKDEKGYFTDSLGHEYVDLGLPSGTLWATRNLGAENYYESGDYFAWGETQGYKSGKTDFTWRTYSLSEGDSDTAMKHYVLSEKYGVVDSLVMLSFDDDAAQAHWGKDWQMPSIMQFSELMNADNCTWKWTSRSGVVGYEVVSRRNGNSLFLPASGYREGTELKKTNFGYYWSNSLNWSFSNQADYLFIKDANSGLFDNVRTYAGYRFYGQNIRPVRVNGKYKDHDYFKPYK